MQNILLSRPLARSEPRSVRARAIAIAHTALRILRPWRTTWCDVPDVSGASAPAQAADPAVQEFAVVIHRPDESTHEHTVWARCSVDVALDVLEDLQRDGCTRFHVQVKSLGATARRSPQ